MEIERMAIHDIPALIWGPESNRVYVCVHGKMGSKDAAQGLAQIAIEKGYQVLSFDLPQHGERKEERTPCDIWQGMHDLSVIGDYAFARWRDVSLFGCSLGAYFSLHAYADRPFRKCLFQSPILDMEYLIRQMFSWFRVTEDQLAQEKEIDTPIDRLRWDYYQYVLAHPVKHWPVPTNILYGGKDDLQSRTIIQAFSRRFRCQLTISEESLHPFMDEKDWPIVDKWLRENL